MRLLGLDYGRKRIGLALSDPLGLTAQPYGTLQKNNSLWEEFHTFVQKHGVDAIVLGYPLSLKGTPGAMAKEVEEFGKALKNKLKVPIHFWDERFTTAETEKLLIQANVRRKKRKEVRDTMAATLILQGYLEAHPYR